MRKTFERFCDDNFALFKIKINDIIKSVLKGTDASLFVDDFTLCIRGSTLASGEREMQLCVNIVQKWILEYDRGFNSQRQKQSVYIFVIRGVLTPNHKVYCIKLPSMSSRKLKFSV